MSVRVIRTVNVPKVKLIVFTFDENVLATNKLSLVYFSFLFFKTIFKIKSDSVIITPYILMMIKMIHISIILIDGSTPTLVNSLSNKIVG